MPKYGYVVVEGPHDVEFVYRLLSPFGLKRVRMEADLDRFLEPLIPRKYPPDGDLQKRMTIPLFLQSDSHAIAVHSAMGDTRIVETVEENSVMIDMAAITGIAVVLDSDQAVPTAERFNNVRTALSARGFQLPANAGQIAEGPPRLGAFVLPDNASQGTLEDLLIECAGTVYPGLLAQGDCATIGNLAYLDSCDPTPR